MVLCKDNLSKNPWWGGNGKQYLLVSQSVCFIHCSHSPKNCCIATAQLRYSVNVFWLYRHGRVLHCQRMRVGLCYELQRETSKQHVGETHSVLTTAILLLQCLSCYWGTIVSLILGSPTCLHLTTVQQRSTGQNLLPDLYLVVPSSNLVPAVDHFWPRFSCDFPHSGQMNVSDFTNQIPVPVVVFSLHYMSCLSCAAVV
jgi:hypothetical protein